MAVPEVQVFTGEGTLKVGMEAAREDRWKRSTCPPYNCLLGGASTLTVSSSSQTCSLLAPFFHMQELLMQKSRFIFLPCEPKSPCLALVGIPYLSGDSTARYSHVRADAKVQHGKVRLHSSVRSNNRDLCHFPDNVCQFWSVLRVTSGVPHVSQGHVPGLWQGWGEVLGPGYFGHCLPSLSA